MESESLKLRPNNAWMAVKVSGELLTLWASAILSGKRQESRLRGGE